jgi:hypothetical protein
VTDLAYTLLGVDAPTVEADAGLAYVSDHRARGLALLLQQFHGKARIESLLGVPLDQIQELEDALWSLLAGRALSTATGIHLDGIGAIVGENRGGLGDEPYRALIRARVVANRSDGHPDELLRIARLVSGVDVTLALTEYPPASLVIEAGNPLDSYTDALAAIVIRLLGQAATGGVRVFFVWDAEPDATSLVFADTTIDADDPQGLGDNTDANVGGDVATVLGG